MTSLNHRFSAQYAIKGPNRVELRKTLKRLKEEAQQQKMPLVYEAFWDSGEFKPEFTTPGAKAIIYTKEDAKGKTDTDKVKAAWIERLRERFDSVTAIIGAALILAFARDKLDEDIAERKKKNEQWEKDRHSQTEAEKQASLLKYTVRDAGLLRYILDNNALDLETGVIKNIDQLKLPAIYIQRDLDHEAIPRNFLRHITYISEPEKLPGGHLELDKKGVPEYVHQYQLEPYFRGWA